MMPLTGSRFVTTALVVIGLLIGGILLPVGVSAEAPKASEPAGFEYAFIFGASSGPFRTDPGLYVGASLGVPIFKADPLFGQTLLGEILLGWSETTRDGLNLTASVGGTPIRELDVTVFQVVPGVKYKLNLAPIQPYLVAGVGFNVVLSKTQPGNLTGGIGPRAAGLGVPAGQGDVLIGANLGGGVDLSLTKNIFVGVDIRHNQVPGHGASFQTYGGKVGFRF